jgi:hypothetical protein
VALSEDRKKELVEKSRALYRRIWSNGPEIRETHACLFHAVALQGLLLKEEGIGAMLQAGSCQWPMVDKDDGHKATHFSYQWEPDNRMTRLCISQGALPEMHVWLALRNPDTLIDPTTGTWPERARVGGHEWTAKPTPPFVWLSPEELKVLVMRDYPLGVLYLPDLRACTVADMLASQEIYPKIAKALGIERVIGRKGRNR